MMEGRKSNPSAGCFKPFLVASCSIPVSIVVGTMFGQSAEMLPQLMDPESSIQITKDEATWIASMLTIGTLISSFICGLIGDIFGRLRMIQLSLFLTATGYAVIAGAPNFMMIIIGRFLCGLGFGFTFPGMIYVGEASPPKYRGSFLTLISIFSSVGLCFMFIIGALLPWNLISGLMCLVSVISFASTFLYYDTPQWLLQKGKTELALKSLRRIEHPANVDYRMVELRDATQRQKEDSFAVGFGIFLEPTVWKPLLMNAALSFLQNGSGFYIMIYYSVDLVQAFKTNLDAHLVTMALGVTRIIATVISSFLLRRMGRRIVGAISGFSSMVPLLLIYAFLVLRPKYPELAERYSWIPSCSLVAFVLTTGLGIYPLPWTMPSEMFPIKVRGLMCGICFAALNLSMFFSLKLYNVMLDYLKIEGTIILFTVFSMAFGIFSLTVLLETHNKTLDEIRLEFSGNRFRKSGGDQSHRTRI